MIEWEQRNIPLLHAGYFGIMIPLTYGKHFLWDMNNTNWCNGFYIQFRQNFAKETFSYDEHLKS